MYLVIDSIAIKRRVIFRSRNILVQTFPRESVGTFTSVSAVPVKVLVIDRTESMWNSQNSSVTKRSIITL